MANEKVISTSALIAKFQYALDNKWGYIWGKKHEYWTKEKQEAYVREYSGDPDRQQSCEYGGKWAGHWVTDCSGLFSWAFEQLGGYMYHGSNTMFNKYCTATGKLKSGKRSDGKTLLPGTAVFTGTDRHGHVGLYIGNGWVIEAQGSKTGVVKSKVSLSKWTYWGELKGVNYGYDSASNGSISSPTPVNNDLPIQGEPTLKRGSKGEYVTMLQTKLKNKGYDLGKYGVDGDFGSATENAVKAFQKDHGLTADGIVGANTWKALNDSSTTKVYYSVTIPHLTLQQANTVLALYKDSYKTQEGR